jgi:hypothetical protein
MRVPKEHGAWAMLYVPFAAGVLAARDAAPAHVPALLALLGSVTGLFLGRESLLSWWRAQHRNQPARSLALATSWQLAGAAICAAILFALRPPAALLPLAIAGALVFFVHIVQMRRREGRTVFGETLAILGLALAAPAAYITGRGEWSSQALVLYVLCVLFFASSVLRVKGLVLAAQPRRASQRRVLQRASIAYHIGLLLIVVCGGLAGWSPLLALVAFLPVSVSAIVSLGTSNGRPNLLRTGLLEIAFSLWFLGFAVATM